METESPSRVLPTFSEAIDAIGMGPFQSRLLLVGGMVRLAADTITIFVRVRCHME